MKKLLLVLVFVVMATSMFAFSIKEKVYNSKTKNYNISIKYPYLTDNIPAAKTINDAIMKDLKNIEKEYKVNYDEGSFVNEVNTIEYEITLNRPDIFSCYLHIYSYTGGAHPICNYYTYNYTIKDGKAKALSIYDLFNNNTEGVKSILLKAINNEKVKREAEALESIETKAMETFTIDPFGVNFIFPQYELGAYSEGEYIIYIKWENVQKFISDSIVNDYVTNPSLRNNIFGKINLTDGKKFPLNTTCEMDLVWIPTNKPGKVLDRKTSKVAMNAKEILFRNSYDWSDKNPLNEYQIQTKIFFDGVLAYNDVSIFTLTEQGWPNAVEIPLGDVHEKDFKNKTFDTVGYIRFNSKVSCDKCGYLEFRLLDVNNKILKKAYVQKDDETVFFDIALDSKNLKELAGLQVFLKNDKNVLANSQIYPLTLKDWTLPEKIDIK